MTSEATDADLEELLAYLKHSRGFDFSAYKPGTLSRRLARRMREVGVESYAEYIDHLEVHPDEFPQLFDTILINVTSFFRDRPAWDYLRDVIVPRVLTAKDADQPIRIWSAGCATGEEAYSLAMLFAEALGRERFREQVKIYATDVDENALAVARQGAYSDRALEAVPGELRPRYFEPSGEASVFSKDLRRNIIFGRHDLIVDAPISHIDLLASRNTLIYFNAVAQARILTRFHFALNNTGFLFLGRAETLLTRTDVFRPTDGFRVFSKVPERLPDTGLALMANVDDLYAGAPSGDHEALRDALFDSDPVAQFVLDDHEVVVWVNRQARMLFPADPDPLHRPVRDLQLAFRPADVRPLLDEARRERAPAVTGELYFPTPDGEDRWTRVEALPIYSLGGRDCLGFHVSLIDVTDVHRLRADASAAHNCATLLAFDWDVLHCQCTPAATDVRTPGVIVARIPVRPPRSSPDARRPLSPDARHAPRAGRSRAFRGREHNRELRHGRRASVLGSEPTTPRIGRLDYPYRYLIRMGVPWGINPVR